MGTRSAGLAALAALLAGDGAGNVLLGQSPPQFDSSLKVATMAAVQRALGNYSGYAFSNTSSNTVSAAQAGYLLEYGTGASTVALPALSSVQNGAAFTFSSIASSAVTINANGSDVIDGLGSGANSSSIQLLYNDTLTLVAIGAKWHAIGCASSVLSGAAMFGSSLGAAGYQKLPSGLIIQWGYATLSANSTSTVTLPIAYPNTNLGALATPDDINANGTNYRFAAGNKTKTTIGLVNTYASSVISGSWFSWGN